MIQLRVFYERAMDYAMKMAGLKKVKKEQRRVIHNFVSGRDVFVSLLTGYGKSFFIYMTILPCSKDTQNSKAILMRQCTLFLFCYALLPAVFDHLRSSIDCDLCFAADCHTNAGSSLRYWWSLALLWVAILVIYYAEAL